MSEETTPQPDPFDKWSRELQGITAEVEYQELIKQLVNKTMVMGQLLVVFRTQLATAGFTTEFVEDSCAALFRRLLVPYTSKGGILEDEIDIDGEGSDDD